MHSSITLASLVLGASAFAQCPFDPTIDPPALILCPSESATLSTQPYDAYQWYKDGNPIPGAIGQTLAVSAFNDAGSSFSVSATLNGCTETSPSVLVDGWVFLLPYVINGGDEPYGFGIDGEQLFCEGDSALLVLGLPYDTNIQWTNNGVPIPGANNDTLVVTTSGNWSVSGAPSLCPDFVQQLGVTITTLFGPAQQAAIVANGGQLCADPPGTSAQWFLNGAVIGTGNCITPTASGAYTVLVDLPGQCDAISAPYDLVLGMEPVQASSGVRAWMDQGSVNLVVQADRPMIGDWAITDITGRHVLTGHWNGQRNASLPMNDLPPGRYWLSTSGQALPVVIVR